MNVHDVILITQNDQDLRATALDDYDKLCRLCLRSFGEDVFRSVHDEEAQMNIRELIEVYTFVKIPDYNDDLPQNICTKCLEFLLDVHMFRNRCRLNNDMLIKLQQKVIKTTNQEAGMQILEEMPLPEDDAQSLIDTINNKRLNLYECKDCQIAFENVNDLRVHRKQAKHPRRRDSQCPHCSKMFTVSALKEHIRTHTGERPYECGVCGVGFSIKKNLVRHGQIHEQRKQYPCTKCNKTFTRTESLANHLKIHENSDEYLCSVCNRTYPSFVQLQLHMRYHNKSFLCNTCGKVFTSKAYLKTHARSHTGEKPYVCHVCSKAFHGQSSLNNHMAMHSGKAKCGRPRKVPKGPPLTEMAEIELATTE